GFLSRNKLRRQVSYRRPAVGNAEFHIRAVSSPFHLIPAGRELLASDSNGLADIQRTLVGIASDGAGCEQQRKCQQTCAEFRLFHKSHFSFCLRFAEASQDSSLPRRKGMILTTFI